MRLKSIAYFKARSLRYQLLTLFGYSAILVALIYIMMPVTHWLNDEILPKLPVGRKFRASVLIELPSEPLPQSVLDLPQQVFAYQSQPKLELIGVGKKVHLETSPPTIEIGLFPRYRERVLKVDSKAEFYFDAPSLALLIQKLRFGEKGKKLRTLIRKAQQDFQNSMRRIWPLFKLTFAKYLNETELNKLLHDEFIMTSLQSALLSEINQRVTLTELKKNLSNLPELEQFLSIATGELSSSKLSQKALLGLFRGGKKAYKDTTKEMKTLWSDDRLFNDSFHCVLQALSQQGTWSTQILSKLLKKQNSSLCKQVKRSLNEMAMSGLKESAKEFSSQAWDNLYREKDSLIELSQSAGKKITHELKFKPILQGFWYHLNSHIELQDYVIQNYGRDSWSR
ncbi:MAG: hypothetical protein CL916_06385, partial [Deltaproteobacteria bacterium]|nr:hypothetical protein [Deltaproteobacteria bacterium]